MEYLEDNVIDMDELGEIDDSKNDAPLDDAVFAEMQNRYDEENYKLLAEAEEAIGQINPYNDQLIENYQDYLAYKDSYNSDALEHYGFTPDIIYNNPVVRQAAQIIEAQRMQAGKEEFDSQLAAISKINPEIKTAKDLMNMPESETFNHLVIDKGYRPLDAYRLMLQATDIPKEELSIWEDAYPNETKDQIRARYNRYLKRQEKG